MKQYLYLHIGSEKTGTTSLQDFLANNRKELDRAGLTYFTDNSLYYSKYRCAHSPIVASFFHEPPDFIDPSQHVPSQFLLPQLRNDLLREKRNIILSSEHFSSRVRSRDDIERLARALTGFNVYVIFYMRPQYELYYSAYITAVMNGWREEFTYQHIHLGNYHLNYLELLQPWAEVFGKQNVIVRDYKKMVDNDTCVDFLRLLGVSNDFKFKRSLRVNLSPTPKGAEIIRRLNSFLPRHGEAGYGVRLLSLRLRSLVAFFVGLVHHDDRVYDLAMKAKIESTFDRTNKELLDTYPDHIEPKEE